MPDQLKELQRLFAEAVLVVGPYAGNRFTSGIGDRSLTNRMLAEVPAGCWFKNMIPGIDSCGGGRADVLEAAHWIKRQQVERWVINNAPVEVDGVHILLSERKALADLAAWDPRNAVPACEHHHRRFDGHHVPLPRERLVVPRHLVPAHVLEFTADYGMETFIEDKHPLEV